jgi:hemerythrin-like domain-containing protein
VTATLIAFFHRFADDCHHAKEEGALFPELELAGYLTDTEPIHALMVEHEQGRALLSSLALLAEHLDLVGSRKNFIETARAYTAMARRHIQIENDVLFVIAERVLGSAQNRWLLSAFATYDRERRGVRERYEQVISELSHELALQKISSVR